MKKMNKWLTVAIGGVLAVAVAAVVIVWSGNQTEEDPNAGLESTNQQLEGPKETDPIVALDPDDKLPRPSRTEDETEEETENPLHDRWEVDPLPDESQVADNSQKPEDTAPDNSTPVVSGPTDAPETEEAAPVVGTPIHNLSFAEGQSMTWPVTGNIIQYYSMDTTVYFPTLEQYKCSPAIEIQSEAGTAVVAPADAKVVALGEDARIGRYVELEIGNGYRLILGQLTDLQVNEGDYVARGTQIAVVASPTRYFVVEGDNLYFQMYSGENTVDPLDYLE